MPNGGKYYEEKISRVNGIMCGIVGVWVGGKSEANLLGKGKHWLIRSHHSRKQNEMRKQTTHASGGRVAWVEGTASAKTLRQECA